MPVLSALFTNPTNFATYVPYLEANVTFDSLDSSAKKAVKKIKIILTPSIFNLIQNLAEGTGTEKKEALRSAVASLTMAEQLPFDIIARRKQNIETYKYESEEMQRGYRQAYFDAMDTLIALLNDEQQEDWLNTAYCKALEGLQIKTTEEFDAIYPIDLSYLFFFRCIPWQKEALEERLEGLFSRVEGKESEIALLKRALAKTTIAKALRRFDILEFPAVIRGLFKDSKAMRYGSVEQTEILRLADQLSAEADQHIVAVESILESSESVESFNSSSPSSPFDKNYLIC